MIKIEFSLAVALYLLLTVSIILIVWMIAEKRNVERYFSSQKEFFWQCNICTYLYIDTKNNPISQCPRCWSLNKRGK